MRKIRSCATIFLLIVSLVAGLSAQTNQGRILGVVTDQSGAVVTGARITITNTATGVTRKYFLPLDPGVCRSQP